MSAGIHKLSPPLGRFKLRCDWPSLSQLLVSPQCIYIYIYIYVQVLPSEWHDRSVKEDSCRNTYLFMVLVWTIPPIEVICTAAGAIAQMYLLTTKYILVRGKL